MRIWLARKPPGFGFVWFEVQDDATNACVHHDGRFMLGKRVRVQLATSPTPLEMRDENANPNVSLGDSHSIRNLLQEQQKRADAERRFRKLKVRVEELEQQLQQQQQQQQSTSPSRTSEKKRATQQQQRRAKQRAQTTACNTAASGAGLGMNETMLSAIALFPAQLDSVRDQALRRARMELFLPCTFDFAACCLCEFCFSLCVVCAVGAADDLDALTTNTSWFVTDQRRACAAV